MMAPRRNRILLALCMLHLSACNPQPRLNIAWYMYPPHTPEDIVPPDESPPVDPRKSEIVLYISHAGGRAMSITNIRIGNTQQDMEPFTLDEAGEFKIVSYIPTAGQEPSATCRLPTSMQILWSPVADNSGEPPKSYRWSRPIDFGGKSPAYIPDAWLDNCHQQRIQKSQ